LKGPDKIKQAPRDENGRVPPGQFVTKKFPVLTYGSTPKIDLSTWRLRLWGLVEKEVTLNWEQFTKLPWTKLTADFHCVTQWSRLDNLWEGVLFHDVAAMAKPMSNAKTVTAHCYGGYTTNVPLEVLMDEDVLLAHKLDGEPLIPEHGWPVRLVVPKRYAWKSAKWLNGLEFIDVDKPGFWEVRGYNNEGDPWKEERFWPELT
jgi:DMSO/TMAO reductase YedYZ molybdopterin-dependent catalytic subunit